MKTIKFIFLACLIGVYSNAQNTITEVFGEIQNDINRAYKVLQLQDSIFLFGGEWNEEAFLYKVNCEGDTLQSKFYGSQIGGSSRIIDFVEDQNGNFTVTGECTNCVIGDTTRYIFLMEVGPNLKVNTTIGIKLHKAYFYSPSPIVNNIFCNPCLEQNGSQKFLIAVKPQAFTDFYLIKLNETLDTVWIKSFDSCDNGSCFDSPRSIAKTENGVAVLVFNALTDSTTVWHFDFDGNPIWKKRYFNDRVRDRKIVYYPSDKLIVGGSRKEVDGSKNDLHLMLLDANNGDVIDEIIEGESEDDEVIDIALLDNGGILVGATFNQPNTFGTYQTSRIYRYSVNPFSIVGQFNQIPNPDIITNMGIRSVFPLNSDGTDFVSVGIRGFYNRSFFYSVNTCSDLDADGYNYSEDCDDNNPNINPGAMEVCNSIDDNCDGMVNEGLTIFTYFEDSDNDLFGNFNSSIDTCLASAPTGFVIDSTDCDDNNPNINPGVMEVCNSIDDNCDGMVNEGLTIFTYFEDSDNDLFGNFNSSIDTCLANAPVGFVIDSTDCDDNDADVNPDADEIPNNGIDEDCDGLDLMTGTENFNTQVEIKIFPIPFKNEITISCECHEDVQIEITNILGQSLFKGRFSSNAPEKRIDVSNYLRGVYWVKIYSDEGKYFTTKSILKVD